MSKVEKGLDLVFFTVYTLYYCLSKYNDNLEKLLSETETVGDEVLSKGFLEILSVLLIIHSIFKLGELSQSLEICRRTILIFKKCFVDSFKLIVIIAIILGAFGVVN